MIFKIYARQAGKLTKFKVSEVASYEEAIVAVRKETGVTQALAVVTNEYDKDETAK